MHVRVFVGFIMALALCTASGSARADQRRDYMVSGLPAGDRLILDYIGTGARATLEHRRPILNNANDYTLSTSALFGYPLAQIEASAALRALFLEFSGTIGYRFVWRNLSFEPGENGAYCRDCDRPARRAKDPLFGSGTGSDEFPFAEARVQLYAPFNEYFVFTSLFALRYESLAPRSYDWFFTTVHDPGLMPRWEATGLFKHKKLGAIGPYVLLQSMPRAGHHDNELAFGLNAMTRLGLVNHNDMLFITFLVRPGDGLYGVHSYFAPVRALIVYRLQLSL
jgi:hypothetical protein